MMTGVQCLSFDFVSFRVSNLPISHRLDPKVRAVAPRARLVYW